jgi:hypothetical protein
MSNFDGLSLRLTHVLSVLKHVKSKYRPEMGLGQITELRIQGEKGIADRRKVTWPAVADPYRSNKTKFDKLIYGWLRSNSSARLLRFLLNDLHKCRVRDNERSFVERFLGAGHADSTRATFSETYLRRTAKDLKVIRRRHVRLSRQFQSWLRAVHAGEVHSESDCVDVWATFRRQSYLFELKICYRTNPRRALREALGQILEYAFFPGRPRRDHLAVVLDRKPTADAIGWIRRLRRKCLTVEVFVVHKKAIYAARISKQPLAKVARAFEQQ